MLTQRNSLRPARKLSDGPGIAIRLCFVPLKAWLTSKARNRKQALPAAFRGQRTAWVGAHPVTILRVVVRVLVIVTATAAALKILPLLRPQKMQVTVAEPKCTAASELNMENLLPRALVWRW
jgi:hypothetical protein